MATYTQYAGSPDLFDASGKYVSTVDWNQNPTINKVATVHPSIKTEADFANPSYRQPTSPAPAVSTPAPIPTTVSAPAYVPPPAPKPQPVVTTNQIRQDQVEAAKPYIRYEGAPEVYDKNSKQWISPEKASEIQKTDPNFWNNIQVSKTPLGAEYSTTPSPIRDIQSVFGSNWQPSAAFTPELQAQGVFGAVKLGDQVFTIGPGGTKESAESYKAKFGRDITDTAGIAGDVDYDQARKLGIIIDSDTMLDPMKDVSSDPFLEPSLTLTSEDKIKMVEGFKDAANKSAGVSDLKTERDTAYANLIKTIADFNTNKSTAKNAESQALGMEAKNQAIVDASNTYTTSLNSYTKAIDLERYKLQPMDIILGKQAKLRSQQAIEMAPLSAAIQIAEGSYSRAKSILDDWSKEYNDSFDFLLKASQTNIDRIEGDLTDAQQTAKEQAQSQLDMWTADYDNMVKTQETVKGIMLDYPEAGITINDSYDTAIRKVSPYVKSQREMNNLKEKLQNDLLKAQIGSENRSNQGGGGGGGGSTVSTGGELTAIEESYAQQVLSGAMKITSVPTYKGNDVRGRVANRVEELKKQNQNKYGSEFEMRVDFNNDMRQLKAAKAAGELGGKPSEITNQMILDYGTFNAQDGHKISPEEIKAAVNAMFGEVQPDNNNINSEILGSTHLSSGTSKKTTNAFIGPLPFK